MIIILLVQNNHSKGSSCSTPDWDRKIIVHFLHWPSCESSESASSLSLAQSVTLQSHSARASDAHHKLVAGPPCPETQAQLWLCHWLRGRLTHQFSPPVFQLPFHLQRFHGCSLRSFLWWPCRSLWKIRYSYFRIWSDIQGHHEPYWTTSITSRVAVPLPKAHSLRDLLIRYKTSSWEYQYWSSSSFWRGLLSIPNRDVLLFLLISCDVRLYTTVPTLFTSPRTFFFFGDP